MSETVTLAPTADRHTKPRWTRLRSVTSVALLVLASLSVLVGGVTLYVREEILNSSAFADRAVNAVHQPVLQYVVAREIAVQLLEPAVPDAIAARPVIVSAVELAVRSKPFAHVIHLAAEHGHRLLFQRKGGNALFDIADAGTVVTSALDKLAPKLAGDLPKRVEAILLTLRRRNFADVTLRVAEKVRLLAIVLPPVAVLLLALGIAVGPERRKAITRAGIAIGVTGIAFAIFFELSRRWVLAHVYGGYELTNANVRGAIGELWGAYLGDLLIWTLAITGVAWLVAAASSSVLRPYSAAEGLRRVRALARRPVSTPVRVVRGASALALGVFAILKPTLALQVAAIVAGALLVYVALSELLSATAPAQLPTRRPRPRRRHAIAFGGVAATVVAAIVVAFALDRTHLARHGRPGADVQRIRAALRPPSERGHLCRHAQRDVRRGLTRVADRQSGPRRGPAARRRHQAVQDLNALRRDDPVRPCLHGHQCRGQPRKPRGGETRPQGPEALQRFSRSFGGGLVQREARYLVVPHACASSAPRAWSRSSGRSAASWSSTRAR